MRRLLTSVPATIALIGVLLVGGVLALISPGFGREIIRATATGYAPFIRFDRWWSPLTYFLSTDNLAELLVALPVVAVCVGFAERRLGTARMIGSAVAAVAAGALVGIAIQELGVLGGEMWSRDVAEFQVVDPFAFVVAALMTATAYTGSIWRSRIRVFTIAVCGVYLLYSGQPSDLYRLLAALGGLGLGMVSHRPSGKRRWDRSTHHEVRVLAATMVAITATGPLLTLLSGRRYGLLAPLGLLMSGASAEGGGLTTACDPLSVSDACVRDITLSRLDSAGPAILTLLPLVLLLAAALGLSRGRRLAAWLTIGLNSGLVVVGAYYYWLLPLLAVKRTVPIHGDRYWEEALSLGGAIVVPIFLAVFVARNLRHFQVHSSPGRVPTFIRNVIISGIALAGLYVGGGWVLHAQFTHSVSFGDLVADLPERFIPVSFLRHELISFLPSSPVTGLLYNWIGPLFWLIIIAGALWAYSDVGARNYTEELPRVRALLQRGGGGFFSQWATWKGNSYWFSADGRASVAYRVIAGVAITTSEPIGDREAARDAISGFARFCDDRGWIPVFYAIHQEYLPAIRRMGWRSITIGEEAVIRPTTWTTTGKRWQDIRTSINRAERAGVRAVWTDYSQLSAKRAEQISRISSEWTNGKALPEMGFTLGSLEELRLPGVALMLACDAEDNILGVTSWLPSYRDGQIIGWTLDFMRRSPDGMNGVMEFLIAKCAERFRDEGAEFMSLSTAPLASTIRLGAPQELSDQLLMRLGSLIEPYYGFRSLFRFKQKFQPELMPISMAYPDALGLPAIGLALARAYLPAITLRQTSNFLRHRKISQPRNLPQPSRDKVLV